MAIHVEVNSRDVRKMAQAIENLAGGKAHQAINRAAKRAAIAARVAATKRIRAIYTIKARDMKSRAKVQGIADGAVIHIKGPMEPVTTYKARRNRKGVFVAIKKGGGSTVPRSFEHGRRSMQREGKSRLPVRGLYGPSVPQLFGNPIVAAAMEERGLEVFEERLLHEYGRLLGGGA